jgi:hypothetical protein
MTKILGKGIQYSQRNNAQVYLFQDYVHGVLEDMKEKKEISQEIFSIIRKKIFLYIACGPTAIAMGLHIGGWSMNVFTKGVQPEDSILMMCHNPNNLKLLKARRPLGYETDKWAPNEIPQIYDVISDILYGPNAGACRYKSGCNVDIIRENIIKETTMMVASGPHYILLTGFSDEKKKIYFKDPFYLNRTEFDMDNLPISNWRVDVKKYEK